MAKQNKSNEERFDEMLKAANPSLHYIFQGIVKHRVQPEIIMEIMHKLWLMKSIDDGTGKVVIARDGPKRRLLIRLITDKRCIELPEEQEVA